MGKNIKSSHNQNTTLWWAVHLQEYTSICICPFRKRLWSLPTGCSWHTNTNWALIRCLCREYDCGWLHLYWGTVKSRVHAGTDAPRLDWVFSASTTVSFHSGLPDASRPGLTLKTWRKNTFFCEMRKSYGKTLQVNRIKISINK